MRLTPCPYRAGGSKVAVRIELPMANDPTAEERAGLIEGGHSCTHDDSLKNSPILTAIRIISGHPASVNVSITVITPR